jgi:hypothetical protein
MHIPGSAIAPLYIASFLMLSFQYFRINPQRRVRNLHFALMVGALVMMLADVFMATSPVSLILFALALLWFALSLYLFRRMPPLGH